MECVFFRTANRIGLFAFTVLGIAGVGPGAGPAAAPRARGAARAADHPRRDRVDGDCDGSAAAGFQS